MCALIRVRQRKENDYIICSESYTEIVIHEGFWTYEEAVNFMIKEYGRTSLGLCRTISDMENNIIHTYSEKEFLEKYQRGVAHWF